MRQSPTLNLLGPPNHPAYRQAADESCQLHFATARLLAFNSRSDRWIEFAQLRTSLRAYFDSVGHETWRGSHASNFPAKSWRRASRSSTMIFGFCDVNQSKSSSRFSTDESTGTGISTVPLGMESAYGFSAANQASSIKHVVPRLRDEGGSTISYQPPVRRSLARRRINSLALLSYLLKLGAEHIDLSAH